MRVLTLLMLSFVASAQTTIPVTVQSLKELLVERELRAPAETISPNQATIAAEISGVIKTVHADTGQQVKAGTLLLKINAADYKLDLKQAEANLASNAARIRQAKQRLDRANELSDKNYIAADDLLARKTDLAVLKAQHRGLSVAINQAKRNIAKTAIKAPFDGVVTERMGQVGSYTTTGTPLFSFVQTGQPEVEAEIPAHLADTLKKANNIQFINGNNKTAVVFAWLSPVIEAGLKIQRARFTFQGIKAPIGSSGELLWKIKGGLLPADLVVRRNGEFGVFIVEDNVARFFVLEQAQEGRPVVVNLPVNTSVIVGGRERLQDGNLISQE